MQGSDFSKRTFKTRTIVHKQNQISYWFCLNAVIQTTDTLDPSTDNIVNILPITPPVECLKYDTFVVVDNAATSIQRYEKDSRLCSQLARLVISTKDYQPNFNTQQKTKSKWRISSPKKLI